MIQTVQKTSGKMSLSLKATAIFTALKINFEEEKHNTKWKSTNKTKAEAAKQS